MLTNEQTLPDSNADEFRHCFAQSVQGGFVHISMQSTVGEIVNVKMPRGEAGRLQKNLMRCLDVLKAIESRSPQSEVR